jgi:DNA topoisomerase-3
MERLLDEVLIGHQEMEGAIDAVCAQASRIIGRLQERGPLDGLALLGDQDQGSNIGRAPTPAMKRFVDGLARQNGHKPPRGYTTSAAVCRAFLDQHAPKRDGRTAGQPGEPKQRRPVRTGTPTVQTVVPKRPKAKARGGKAAGAASRTKRAGHAPDAADGDTPLNIPFGNKETALQLGARYRTGGWYAPSGVDLSGFQERGWL